MGEQQLPDTFAITVFDAMVLYYNTMRASQLGWTDADKGIEQFIRDAKQQAIQIKRGELEAMLASCIQNSEADNVDYFWHPLRRGVKAFIKDLTRHKSDEVFYNTFYNYFTTVKHKEGQNV